MILSGLIMKLEQAEKLLSEFRGGYSGEFLSAQEFHASVLVRVRKKYAPMRVPTHPNE